MSLQHNHQYSFALSIPERQLYKQPKLPYASAAKALAQIIPALEVDFDAYGEIRHISSSARGGLHKDEQDKEPGRKALELLKLPLIQRAFGLKHAALMVSAERQFGFGHRVDFQQVAPLIEADRYIPVRGGAVSVALDHNGRIFSVTSTLKRGRRVNQSTRMISFTEAIRRAEAKFHLPVTSSTCDLVFSSHNGQMNLAFEVTLESNQPRDVVTYLVLARTGRVVHEQFKLWRSSGICSRTGVNARALLSTPDPTRRISSQTSQVLVKELPNPAVLRNKYFAMFLGHERRPVFARHDGTYCYSVRDPEFAAVSVFLALNSQLNLYRELGMAAPERVLSVYVNDPTVPDNAYFDPINYEMRIGIGSGVKHRGLNKCIAFDLGVCNHEFGHNAVFLQAPGHDLPGREGAALHEATGDVLGTLVMDYLFRIRYARQLGKDFTREDLLKDRRLIGKYALPPYGLRSQLNTRRTPDDLIGQPHSDGLIAGGALADLLVAMSSAAGVDLEGQLKLFAKINLTALALVPMHKVSFKDMLRALITADQLETAGSYRKLIERCFAAHGITLGAHGAWLRERAAA